MDEISTGANEVGHPERPWDYPIPLLRQGDHIGTVLADGELVIERIQLGGPPGDPALVIGDLAGMLADPTPPPFPGFAQLVESMDAWLHVLLGIPAGFPLWYVPPRPALPVGPIGRAIRDGNWREARLRTLAARSHEFWQLPPDPFGPSEWIEAAE